MSRLVGVGTEPPASKHQQIADIVSGSTSDAEGLIAASMRRLLKTLVKGSFLQFTLPLQTGFGNLGSRNVHFHSPA
jgi:hypothetical protein